MPLDLHFGTATCLPRLRAWFMMGAVSISPLVPTKQKIAFPCLYASSSVTCLKMSREVVAEEMRKLMDEGKIRYWGISNASDDYIRRADAVCKVTAVQERYSMMARWNEEKFAMLEELGIGFAAYSPMANGFLSAGLFIQ